MIIYQTCPERIQATWQKLTIDEMAATMQDMDAVGEAVTPENLRLRGYSKADITRFGLPAANLARKRSTKLVTV